jgi:DNA primase
MNCEKANEISIAGFLSSKGINPAKESGNSLWYCSPLRNEETPSFKVNRAKNVWFDYGGDAGTGGRLVDLVCGMYRVSVPGALIILSGAVIDNTPVSFSDQQNTSNNESRIEIKHVQSLQNKALIQYLDLRKIPFKIASRYVEEAYYNAYSGQIKPYFAIAFRNDEGGFELRNGIQTKNFPGGFKGSSSPKAISTIHGTANGSVVNVFEGFMDFLSALTWFNTYAPTSDTIVLNGLGFLDRFIDLMPGYTKINLWLDNDRAGKEAATRIQALRPDAVNRSLLLFPKHKDFIGFITSKKTTAPDGFPETQIN